MLSIVIVEDEIRSREVLKNLLLEYCKDVSIDGLASNVEEGVKIISSIKPDVVFLDVEMHPGTGFDILERLDFRDFDIIFTTAYDHYALRAIKASAIAYLLKPIDIQELQEAVTKVQIRKGEKVQAEQIKNLLSSIHSGSKHEKIALKANGIIKFVSAQDISYCQADGSYTYIYLRCGAKLLQSKNLKEFEELLSKDDFIRVHHSFLVNIDEVDSWIKSPNNQIIMKDGTSISISSKGKDVFMARMNLK